MYNNQAVKGGYHIRPVLFCGDISNKQEETLSSMGYQVIRLPAFSHLDERVATHPDMLLFVLDHRILLQKAYFEANKDFFLSLPFSFITTDEEMGKSYPQDVLFNALPIGNTVYGGKRISHTIEAFFPRKITVKQGYTRCSSCLVGNGVITQDPTVYQALKDDHIPALLISQGHIHLTGYDTGFIGGASLTLSPNLTAFFGQIESHPDYERMKDFATQRNATLLSLSNEPLTDYGGGFCLHHTSSTFP